MVDPVVLVTTTFWVSDVLFWECALLIAVSTFDGVIVAYEEVGPSSLYLFLLGLIRQSRTWTTVVDEAARRFVPSFYSPRQMLRQRSENVEVVRVRSGP